MMVCRFVGKKNFFKLKLKNSNEISCFDCQSNLHSSLSVTVLATLDYELQKPSEINFIDDLF